MSNPHARGYVDDGAGVREETDDEYSRRIMRVWKPDRGSVADLRRELDEMAHTRVPAGVDVVALIVTMRGGGWRCTALRFALWLIAKAGHEVIERGKP